MRNVVMFSALLLAATSTVWACSDTAVAPGGADAQMGDDAGADGQASLLVDAGVDQSVDTTVDSVTFTAQVNGLAAVTSIAWTQVAGSALKLDGAGTASLKVSNLQAGVFDFRVTVKTASGQSASDDVRLTVFEDKTACKGNKYYVATTGSDSAGDGSQAKPWASLAKAAQSTKTAGATISVGPGTFTESTRCELAVGVCLEGAGPSTIIKSTITAEFAAIIVATSAEGTGGHQHISNLKLDGNNRTTKWAIEVRGRSNFSIHDIEIADFEDSGVIWGGRADNEEKAPAIWATGNSFYRNITANSSKHDGYGRGHLSIGGQDGMRIYDNTMTQAGRGAGKNGWLIKGQMNDGYLRGVKIYNNKITKEAFDGVSWDFAIELFRPSGVEIYGNTIVGSIDSNLQLKGAYPYSMFIHDNTIGPAAIQNKLENGIILEFDTESAIIANNHIKNVAVCVYFTPRPDSHITGLRIRNNLCENIGIGDGSRQGFAVRFNDPNGFTVNDATVDNNTFIAAAPNLAPFWGVAVPQAPTTNYRVRNNVITGFNAGYVTAGNGGNVNGLYVQNNLARGNGNNNEPAYANGKPAINVVERNLVDTDPMLNADFSLKAGSPCIDKGMDVGQPYSGAAPDIGYLESK
jgi:hypothetical protein